LAFENPKALREEKKSPQRQAWRQQGSAPQAVILSIDETAATSADEQCRMKVGRLLLGAAGILFSAGLLSAAMPAAAEPATTVRYPRDASATRFNGYAFDACTAPSASTMKRGRRPRTTQ